jgi:glyoxylase-like metal-dependent hydrolase (beta-lactamase superfamily II)
VSAITIDRPYTGHVSPDANPQQRDLAEARIIKTSVGGHDNNVYLIQCRESGSTLLIDAANEPERLIALIRQETPGIDLIVTTHQHIDHWWALPDVVKATGAASAAHPLDAEPLPVAPDRLLSDGDSIQVGRLVFRVIHLAGHTPGGVALAFTDTTNVTHLFSGDSLFPGGVGKTADPEKFTSLIDDVETKVFQRYPDDTIVYPGHGDDTTLGTERPHLAQWRSRGW